MSRSIAPVLLPVDISGQHLTPRLYRTTGPLEITSADVLLDAQGDVNAVWIFQVPSTLHVAAGRQIILSNGAKARNIYWQVGSSATLGEYAVFRGTIMATESITLLTAATIEGRALTHTGSVGLSANTITRPDP